MNDRLLDEFFKVGGALDPDHPSYVTRQDDEELIQAALAGEYCNVLTARQTGKSSMMNRTVRRLQEQGVKTVVIDLTSLGADQISAEQWYFGLISRFRRELSLNVDEYDWWDERQEQGLIQRFTDFLRLVLDEVEEPIVVFIDEIDTTLGLPFTDDFFAAIRAMYNARSRDEIYKRLTFILLGVVRASDLIAERTRTPYNIGRLFELHDFTADEAQALLPGLEVELADDAATTALQRVLYWTDGHPYLTQRTCAEITANGQTVDDVVEHLFFTDEARKELNLQFIRDRVRQIKDRGGMLRVYRRIHDGKRIADEARSSRKSQLKLTGLAKTQPSGELVVRNRIYFQVFDKDWIRDNMPVSPTQRLAIAAVILAILAVAVVTYLIYRERTRPPQILAETYTASFLEGSNPDVRFNNLANLFQLEGFEQEARDIYFQNLGKDEGSIFTELDNPGQLGGDVLVVVEGTYRDIRLVINDTRNPEPTLLAMAAALESVEEGEVPGALVTRREIEFWADGHQAAAAGELEEAIEHYSYALELKGNNPAIFYDRGRAHSQLSAYEAALADYNAALGIELDENMTESWRIQIAQDIVDNTRMHDVWWRNRTQYPNLGNLIAVPTDTPTPTPTQTDTPRPTQATELTQTTVPTEETSPTPSSVPTLTPSPIPTSTHTPLPTETQVPLLIVNLPSGELRNPINFAWTGPTSWRYRVVLRHLTEDYAHVSDFIEGYGWTYDIPGKQFGAWEWYVESETGVISDKDGFFFNPHSGGSAGGSAYPGPGPTSPPKPTTSYPGP